MKPFKDASCYDLDYSRFLRSTHSVKNHVYLLRCTKVFIVIRSNGNTSGCHLRYAGPTRATSTPVPGSTGCTSLTDVCRVFHSVAARSETRRGRDTGMRYNAIFDMQNRYNTPDDVHPNAPQSPSEFRGSHLLYSTVLQSIASALNEMSWITFVAV